MNKKFKVCTSGKTVDGREIKAEWLTQMAAAYDPKLYGARINCEHMIGLKARGDFAALGDVVALSTEVEGEETCLYAELDPTDDLIKLVADRQKVYTSVEINPSFRDTDKAYLMGIAVTDSPASVGTEMLSFARDRGVSNKFTEALECNMQSLCQATNQEDFGKGVLETIKAMFAKKQAKEDEALSQIIEQNRAITLVAQECDKAQADIAALQKQNTELTAQIVGLTKRLQGVDDLLATQDPNQTPRPYAAGEVEQVTC